MAFPSILSWIITYYSKCFDQHRISHCFVFVVVVNVRIHFHEIGLNIKYLASSNGMNVYGCMVLRPQTQVSDIIARIEAFVHFYQAAWRKTRETRVKDAHFKYRSQSKFDRVSYRTILFNVRFSLSHSPVLCLRLYNIVAAITAYGAHHCKCKTNTVKWNIRRMVIVLHALGLLHARNT